MKKTTLLITLGLTCAAGLQTRAQIIDTEDGEVAGIHVNYTEAKTGSYTLPDPLQLSDGAPVTSKQIWFEKRRPELVELIETQQYGRTPQGATELSFEVTEKGTLTFDGKAIRKQVTLFLTADKSHFVDVLIYLPSKTQSASPLLLQAGWGPNNLQVEDPGVKIGRRWNRETATREPAESGRRFGSGLTVLPLIERGYATAVFNYSDIEPDALNGFDQGIRKAYLNAGKSELGPEEWGSIAAWAWGISRMVDYFEEDQDIDEKCIAITGASRLGKTVLWAGARDPRIACVIAGISGEGGAALSRREYGETIAHLVAPSRYPYQFAGNYQNWANDPNAAPFDSHMLIALIAPRPLLLQTGNTDKWSDPYGEFLAAKAASPVYELLGEEGIQTYSQPIPSEPLLTTLGYTIHDGGHAVLPSDWEVYLDFMDKHLMPQNAE